MTRGVGQRWWINPTNAQLVHGNPDDHIDHRYGCRTNDRADVVSSERDRVVLSLTASFGDYGHRDHGFP